MKTEKKIALLTKAIKGFEKSRKYGWIPSRESCVYYGYDCGRCAIGHMLTVWQARDLEIACSDTGIPKDYGDWSSGDCLIDRLAVYLDEPDLSKDPEGITWLRYIQKMHDDKAGNMARFDDMLADYREELDILKKELANAQ